MTGPRRGLIVAGLVALAAYAFLKGAWGLGSDVGIVDQVEFDRVFGSLSGLQVWLATWGTVVLAAAGAVLLLIVAADARTPLGRRPFRALSRGFAWAISVALGGVALVALGATVAGSGPSPFSTWVSYLTYGTFLVYSVALGQMLRWTRTGSKSTT